MERHRGAYKITLGMLKKFLELDDEHTILAVEKAESTKEFEGIKVFVEGPCMPKIYDNHPIPYVPLDQIKYIWETYLKEEMEKNE